MATLASAAAAACSAQPSQLPARCADVLAGDPAAPDGEYELYVDHDPDRPWRARCDDMASGEPVEYLPLVRTGRDDNFSEVANQVGDGQDIERVRTSYLAVRIDPLTFRVDIGDRRHARDSGTTLLGGRMVTEVAFGVASACRSAPPGTGSFEHTPTDACASCHNGVDATGRSATHVTTTTTCESCHATSGWTPVDVEHAATIGTCVSCHDNVTATGKPLGHVATVSPCDGCHATVGWLPATSFTHTEQTENCVSCHDGLTAPGKPVSHPSTTNTCADCHSTVAWLPATLDHGDTLDTCEGCHGAPPPQHLPTDNSCEECHGTKSWTPTLFDHSTAQGPCAQCHDGVQATGLPLQQHPASTTCQQCHGVWAWRPVIDAGHQPTWTSTCGSCHDGVTASGRSSAHWPSSDGCHLCHGTVTWAPPLPIVHPTPGDDSCTDCHVSAPHASYSTSCRSCHWAGQKPQEPLPLVSALSARTSIDLAGTGFALAGQFCAYGGPATSTQPSTDQGRLDARISLPVGAGDGACAWVAPDPCPVDPWRPGLSGYLLPLRYVR